MEIIFWGLGAIGFWIFIGLVSLVLMAALKWEKVGWSSLLLLGTMAFLQFGTTAKPFTAVYHHPWWSLLIATGYFLAGGAWCIGKWWFFVTAARRKYEEEKLEFYAAHSVTGDAVPEGVRIAWARHVQECSWPRKKVIPMPREHKGLIMTWLVYWPWSLVWTIIDDPIKRIFREIYNAIRSTLERISNNVFKGVEEELAVPPEPEPEPDRDGGIPEPEPDRDGGSLPNGGSRTEDSLKTNGDAPAAEASADAGLLEDSRRARNQEAADRLKDFP